MEALLYFGKRANIGALPGSPNAFGGASGELGSLIAPMAALFAEMDSSVRIGEDRLHYFFDSFENFPAREKGAFSVASLITEAMIPEFSGDFSSMLAHIKSLSAEEIRSNFCYATLLTGEYLDDGGNIGEKQFLDRILALNTTPETKLKILSAYKNMEADAEELFGYLESAARVIEDSHKTYSWLIDRLTMRFAAAEDMGAELSEHVDINLEQTLNITVFPSVVGYNYFTALSTPKLCLREETFCYLGVLRRDMKGRKNRGRNSEELCSTIKALGDRSRFDILCYLTKHTVYGQELSAKFMLSKNTVYYHLNRLQELGFVSCTMDGNRAYYSANRDRIEEFIEQQRRLLLGGNSDVQQG